MTINQQEITEIQTQLQAGLTAFQGPIETDADLAQTDQALTWVKVKNKFLDKTLKEFTKPHRDAEKIVRDWFRPSLDAGSALEALLKQRIGAYHLAQQAKQTAQLEAARVQFQAGQVEAGREALALVPEQAQVKGLSVRTVWQFEVLDPDLVPPGLCSPDVRKIEAQVAAGARDIPGVRVWQGAQVSKRV
jgi:Arc/MetJ family transcription regulator